MDDQPKHPMQPIVKDKNGRPRFLQNPIVLFLLDAGQFDLNALSTMGFSQRDWVQFYQLIGYSLQGFHELSDVPDDVAAEASRLAIESGFSDTGCRSVGCTMHCGVEWDS